MADGSKTKTVYHYTDQKGKAAIEKTGQIKPSKDGAFGPGVYFTAIPPTAGRKAVSKNNWDGGWQTRESKGRADCAVAVQMPTSQLTKQKAPGRNVLTHSGPVKLSSHNWTSMQKK